MGVCWLTGLAEFWSMSHVTLHLAGDAISSNRSQVTAHPWPNNSKWYSTWTRAIPYKCLGVVLCVLGSLMWLQEYWFLFSVIQKNVYSSLTHMSMKMMSKIFIFFGTSYFAAYISAYIRWPVPGVPYLSYAWQWHKTLPKMVCLYKAKRSRIFSGGV